jgi:DNA-directed RNA polymerase specialized sigma24 family protein
VDFDAAWPSVQRRVTALLRSRGVQATDVDDIGQEVAFRALRDPDRFASDEHLERWCCRVAINLHIDSTRRQRRVSGHAPPDVAGLDDTADTVEHRMTLDYLMAHIAKLSPDEQRLLLDPAPADSRREAVRLAVRRHRLRARLVASLERLTAAFPLPWLRRMVRRLPPPARVSLAAIPVVACLMIVPGWVSRPSAPPDSTMRPQRAAPAALAAPQEAIDARTAGATPTQRDQPGPRPAIASRPAGGAPPAGQTVLEFNPIGPPVRVRHVQRPDDAPTFCTIGKVAVCVNRPGPVLQKPAVPPLP